MNRTAEFSAVAPATYVPDKRDAAPRASAADAMRGGARVTA